MTSLKNDGDGILGPDRKLPATPPDPVGALPGSCRQRGARRKQDRKRDRSRRQAGSKKPVPLSGGTGRISSLLSGQILKGHQPPGRSCLLAKGRITSLRRADPQEPELPLRGQEPPGLPQKQPHRQEPQRWHCQPPGVQPHRRLPQGRRPCSGRGWVGSRR